MEDDVLARRINFIAETDKLKSIRRKTGLFDGSRPETVAEHCWQAGLFALIFADTANVPIDINRVIRMLLIHDVVEVDTGDVLFYERSDQLDRDEAAAAVRLFGLLPQAQGAELLPLWQEFDARETPDAKFAAAIDRVIPIIENYHAKGGSWLLPGIHAGLVLERCRYIQEGSQSLWTYAQSLITKSIKEGFLKPAP